MIVIPKKEEPERALKIYLNTLTWFKIDLPV